MFIWLLQIRQVRDEENRAAVAALEYTYEEAKKYIVPELTPSQRRKLARLSKEELKMFFFTEDDFNELENNNKSPEKKSSDDKWTF